MTDPAQTQSSNRLTNVPTSPAAGGSSVSGKEKEVGVTPSGEVPALKEVGQEVVELSPEVSAAGVKVQPTTVTIPPKVGQMGVRPLGTAQPPPATAVTLPLTDDQIAQGLHQSITSSWRWLAEWCRRRLKQMHVVLKTIHGRLTRVRA